MGRASCAERGRQYRSTVDLFSDTSTRYVLQRPKTAVALWVGQFVALALSPAILVGTCIGMRALHDRIVQPVLDRCDKARQVEGVLGRRTGFLVVFFLEFWEASGEDAVDISAWNFLSVDFG